MSAKWSSIAPSSFVACTNSSSLKVSRARVATFDTASGVIRLVSDDVTGAKAIWA